MSYCNYLEAKILDHVFGGSSYTRPSTIYIGLCTGVDEDGTITGEPSGNNYSRVAKDNDSNTWNAASGGSKTNKIDIEFPEASGAWGTLTKFFISDASSGNTNTLGYGDLSASKSPTAGDVVKFPAGQLAITLD